MKGVFDTRPLTEYDDDVSRRYHFPNRYLAEAERVAEGGNCSRPLHSSVNITRRNMPETHGCQFGDRKP